MWYGGGGFWVFLFLLFLSVFEIYRFREYRLYYILIHRTLLRRKHV